MICTILRGIRLCRSADLEFFEEDRTAHKIKKAAGDGRPVIASHHDFEQTPPGREDAAG